jgi:DNA polymerase III alpha subunit
MASFLDKEPESRKEKAINLAKQHGYEIKPLNINYSEDTWKIQDNTTLVAPLTTIKGLGTSAYEQIIMHRPFNTAEEMLFHPDVKYNKLNKKAFDVLCRAGAMNDLIDERFTGDKHFWSAVCLDKPRTKKKLDENIETYRAEGSFSEEEKIEFIADLTGIFPMSMVISSDVQRRLDEKCLPPISEYDRDLQLCWCIPRSVTKKKTRTGKTFYVIKVIDSNSIETQIRCWGVNSNKDKVHINRPYLLKPRYDETWGFSTYGNVDNCWALLG